MTPGVYVNFMSGDEDDRVPEAYRERWDRLVDVKSHYDPYQLLPAEPEYSTQKDPAANKFATVRTTSGSPSRFRLSSGVSTLAAWILFASHCDQKMYPKPAAELPVGAACSLAP